MLPTYTKPNAYGEDTSHTGKMAQNFPVRTQQWRGNVSGITTDFISSLYADRLMVVATQVGALGTIQSAKAEAVLEGRHTFTVETLLGRRDETTLTICPRALSEKLLDAGCSRPLLLCIGLRDHSRDAMRSIIQEVLAHPLW
ncbi:g11901 [Coccomyxa viridis]|uniref:G11901 protein n=1 Tax=Coccomyxa viridis TaxID=1274662 RepID=A0ABP1GG29_9CHLO